MDITVLNFKGYSALELKNHLYQEQEAIFMMKHNQLASIIVYNLDPLWKKGLSATEFIVRKPCMDNIQYHQNTINW